MHGTVCVSFMKFMIVLLFLSSRLDTDPRYPTVHFLCCLFCWDRVSLHWHRLEFSDLCFTEPLFMLSNWGSGLNSNCTHN